MCCPEILTKTPKLTNPKASDYVDVNVKTLRHNHYDNIFALGDCAALPTSKTAAAVAGQVGTLEKNICDIINGGQGNVSEVTEFDYRAKPLETLPIDQGKERYLFYFTKTYLLPPLYWDGLLRAKPLETLPIDQGKERYLFYFTKTYLLPPLYWDGLL
ncbi:eukaryotic sulfide quinone oxidoreductase, partial [Schistosoma bovis]